jgi:hypothetical protein
VHQLAVSVGYERKYKEESPSKGFRKNNPDIALLVMAKNATNRNKAFLTTISLDLNRLITRFHLSITSTPASVGIFPFFGMIIIYILKPIVVK